MTARGHTLRKQAGSSMKDVAKLAGVSTATVSHVLNNSRIVTESTRLRVIEAIQRLNYSPDVAARSLRSRRSTSVGLIIPVKSGDTSAFYFLMAAHGLEQGLRRAGYRLLFGNSNENLDDERKEILEFNSHRIAGLVIATTFRNHHFLKEVLNGEYPVVFIDRRPKGYDGDCVLIDNYSPSRDATKLLVAKGHRRVGYISGPLGLTTSDERHLGYRTALKEEGIAFNESFVWTEDDSLESGAVAARKLLEKRVTAIFVANNVMAMGVWSYLQQRGVRIPGDVAVIGYDDYEWSKITLPKMSVIRQPAYEMGLKAAEVLMERIQDPTLPRRDIRLPAELILREST